MTIVPVFNTVIVPYTNIYFQTDNYVRMAGKQPEENAGKGGRYLLPVALQGGLSEEPVLERRVLRHSGRSCRLQ